MEGRGPGRGRRGRDEAKTKLNLFKRLQVPLS